MDTLTTRSCLSSTRLAKIRDAIEATRGFVGISGVFNFSKTDHNGLSKNSFALVKVSNGKWTLAK